MTDQELQQKYPAYSKSIFADFKPDNSEVLGWQQNVSKSLSFFCSEVIYCPP